MSGDRFAVKEPELSLQAIRDTLGISRKQMAHLLDASTRTIERWESRTTLPAREINRSRLAKLQEIVELGTLVYGSGTFQDYVSLRMPGFDGHTALQLIDLGEADRVYAALAADYEGQGF
jgi:DNA-binding XRE family transcriptional regulator